jgi:hypothetical protein
MAKGRVSSSVAIAVNDMELCRCKVSLINAAVDGTSVVVKLKGTFFCKAFVQHIN